jgi:hypothetical protein
MGGDLVIATQIRRAGDSDCEPIVDVIVALRHEEQGVTADREPVAGAVRSALDCSAAAVFVAERVPRSPATWSFIGSHSPCSAWGPAAPVRDFSADRLLIPSVESVMREVLRASRPLLKGSIV